jgi:hypothetical protein
MSNPQQQQQRPAPQVPDEIEISELVPASPGAGIGVGDLTKSITARGDDKSAPGYGEGFEIAWVRSRRAFRVTKFHGGQPTKPRWIMEHHVKDYVEA